MAENKENKNKRRAPDDDDEVGIPKKYKKIRRQIYHMRSLLKVQLKEKRMRT